MAISPGMIKILGSIASSAMSSKGKEESRPEPKLNSNFLIDADKQAPLNNRGKVEVFNTRPLSTRLKGVAVNHPSLEIKGNTSGVENLKKDIPKPKSKKDIRLGLRNKRRADRAKRVDTDPLTGKYVKGSGAGGTDVGNFFRRMADPSANQNPPSTTNTNNTQNNYEEEKEESNNKLNTNYLSLMDKQPGYFQPKQTEDLDHKSVGLSKKYKNK